MGCKMRNNLKRDKKNRTDNRNIKVQNCSNCPLVKYVGGPDVCAISELDISEKETFQKCPLKVSSVTITLVAG